MKRLIPILLLLLLGGWTSAGFDFRSTSGFCADAANTTYVLKADTWSQSRGGFTFGWESLYVDPDRDRDAGVDCKLAGVHQQPNDGTQSTWRLTLTSAGTYTVCIALGDYGSDQGYQYLQLQDNTTPVLTIDDTDGTVNGHYDDAHGTDRTAAAWPGSNTCETVVFSTTTARVVIGSPSAQSGSSTIAHIDFTLQATSTGSAILNEDY